MASKFWGGASSSEDESDHSSGDEDVKVPSRFARGAEPESSDSEEEFEQVKRVVKSARDKRFEEFAAILQRIRNNLKINDWNNIVEEYEKLNKQLDKSKQIVAKEGVPRLYIRTLIVLEDALKKTQENKSSIKMNATNAKSFNAMRQKVKKNNKNYEKQIEEYRKNPDQEDDDGEEREEKSESESEAEPEPESEEEKSASEASEKSQGESDEDGSGDDDEYHEEEASRSKWFTSGKATTKTDAKDDKDRRRHEGKPNKPSSGSKKPKAEKEEAKPTEMNEEQVKAKLKEILAERGKKKTDASKQIAKFSELLPFAKSPELEVEILIHLISSEFDMNRSVATALPVAAWKSALEHVRKVLTILEQNPHVVLNESDITASSSSGNDAAGADSAADGDELKQVSGNLMAFIERLDDEYIKSLQNIDPHTKDYIQRLQDENPFLQVAELTQKYYEQHGKFAQAARIAERHIEHVYFRQDNAEKRSEVEPVMVRLTELVYAHGDDRLKIRTLLCNVYFNALLDKFYEARDMMLMSHLQDSISHTDVLTQILFNRTMVQLGLCAFRAGLIKQAHGCLSEICAGGRVKELLAQGTNTRFHDRNPEQEKEERRRQLPYHMHINQDVLDAVHYICAMLLEVPNMAAHAFDVKKKLISRPFRRLLEAFEKSVFNGPPENTRDVIVHAAKALEAGDWKQSQDLIFGLPIWALLPNADKLKEMLAHKIKEEGLRTYLFSFNTLYDSISLEHLVNMFELDKNAIHSIVSKMMINEELHASWDQPTGSIIMHQVEPTRLQYLAMQLAEKAAVFVENNEKLLEAKTGSSYSGGYNKSDQDQKGGQQKGGQRQRGGQFNKQGGQQQGGKGDGQRGGQQQQDRNKGRQQSDRNNNKGGQQQKNNNNKGGQRNNNNNNRGNNNNKQRRS